MERATILIQGRVQGVGFRYFAADHARRLGLSGTVRNLPDGGVEAVAIGPRRLLDELIVSLEQGPPAARVDRVTAHFSAPGPLAEGFHITG